MPEYFSHDYDARRDPKMVNLRRVMGFDGIGIFWSLVEYMYEQNGYMMLSQCECIADELHTQCDKLLKIINEFDLFKNDGEKFWSNTILERIGMRKDKSEKASKSAKIRWNNANAMRTQCDGNAKKEIKGKEIKGNKKKENTYSENCIFLYSLYPSTDKNNQGRSTGKCGKCKDKIEAILKTRSFEELKTVFENYLLLSEKKGSWLKNFETFLNQLPDPVEILEVPPSEKYEPIDPCRTILPRRKPSDYE